jgi:hypothetical protein
MRTFGIIFQGKRFIGGLQLPDSPDLDLVKWRNDLFERCDAHTMRRFSDAQPQPRP